MAKGASSSDHQTQISSALQDDAKQQMPMLPSQVPEGFAQILGALSGAPPGLTAGSGGFLWKTCSVNTLFVEVNDLLGI
jgi:hypothetical protein